MPYATNNGVKIYYEVEGQGPPLILAHPSGATLDRWRQCGWTDALRDTYTLVLFDARGYGRSGKPHDVSAYELSLRLTDVTAVLDHLGIKKAHYFGYSMGAQIGFWLAIRATERFDSFILGGMSSYRGEVVQKAIQEGKDVLLYQMRVDDPEKALLLQEQFLGHPMTKEEKDSVLANDARAQLALVLSLRAWRSLTDDELSRITAPCLLLCGNLDPRYSEAMESARHISQATFVSLPGLDHSAVFRRSAVALPHVKEFLAKVGNSRPLASRHATAADAGQ